MSEAAFLNECRRAIEEGWLIDDKKSPLHVVVTVVGSIRSDRDGDAYDFVVQLGNKYPHARLRLGDTSTVEKQAALAGEHMNLEVTIIAKAEKNEWDEGPDVRDERVVGRCTQVVAFDKSSRSQSYQKRAKTLCIPFHQL